MLLPRKVHHALRILGEDWSQNNASSPGSASSLRVQLVGGTYTPAAAQDFTAWSADGQWGSQVLTWTLTSNVASIRIRVTGQNSNHHRYVAYDACGAPTPTHSSTWGQIKVIYR